MTDQPTEHHEGHTIVRIANGYLLLASPEIFETRERAVAQSHMLAHERRLEGMSRVMDYLVSRAELTQDMSDTTREVMFTLLQQCVEYSLSSSEKQARD